MIEHNLETNKCQLSIVIKALNEERRIAAAIESALKAVVPFDGEVILADSCSSDLTIEIAKRYPICIVQLVNSRERCCGVGPQLGFQHSAGEYVYILDGDMEVLPGFMEKAVSFLSNHPNFGGVGGLVKEMNTDSLEYVSRIERASDHMRGGEVDRLDMGGLYRRRAIEEVGYFSNRNLHSYEEYDLGVRLRAAGWKLQRLDIESVRHYGHDEDPYKLLLRRWRTAYICGLGELFRGAVGKAHFGLITKELRELKIYGATMLIWLILIVLFFMKMSLVMKILIFMLLLIGPVLLMGLRKNSMSKAIYSVVSWHLNAAGFVRGFMQKPLSPRQPIESVMLSKN